MAKQNNMVFGFEKYKSSSEDQEIKKKTENLNKSGRFKFGEDQVREVEEWEKKKTERFSGEKPG